MSVQERIQTKLTERFAPKHLEVLNESHQHAVPRGSETHFKVILVSDVFNGLSRIQRQQLVYETLREELNKGLHALSLKTSTPAEWMARPEMAPSPRCLGGSKNDPQR